MFPPLNLPFPPSPPSEPAFEDCAVQVDGKSVHVHKATVNRSAPNHGIVPETVGFATFDFCGQPSSSPDPHQSTRTIGSSGSRQPATGSPGGAAGHRPATRIILPDLIGADTLSLLGLDELDQERVVERAP